MASQKKSGPRKTSCQRTLKYFKEYCDRTSIHGFRYFSEDRPLYEKICWLIAILTCTILCGIMINNILHKFIQYPVIVTFSMQETTLYKIPFPAVTLCTKARISQSYFNTSIKNYPEKWTDVDRANLNMATIVCDETFSANVTEETVNVTQLNEFFDKSKTDFVFWCYFMDLEIPCEEFTPILTEDGLCYSFNILDKTEIFTDGVFSDNDYFVANKSEDYHVERGFGMNVDLNTYPRRALLPGAKNSLQLFFVTQHSDIEYECADDERGYKISLHLPGKIPNMAQEYFIVPLDQLVLGTIIPQVITTSDAVKVYDPAKRDCFFQSEKHLRFFKIYTHANCQLECLTNFTFSKCECVAYFMPRFAETSICGSAKSNCLYEAEREFALQNIKANIRRDRGIVDAEQFPCNCLPMCTDISYNLEISQNPLDWKERLKNYLKMNKSVEYDELNVHYSGLSLFFKTNHIETKERHAMYGFTDFLSNFGGLLGLFTGFSILSFVEIIYFLTIRLIGNVKRLKVWNSNKTV